VPVYPLAAPGLRVSTMTLPIGRGGDDYGVRLSGLLRGRRPVRVGYSRIGREGSHFAVPDLPSVTVHHRGPVCAGRACLEHDKEEACLAFFSTVAVRPAQRTLRGDEI